MLRLKTLIEPTKLLADFASKYLRTIVVASVESGRCNVSSTLSRSHHLSTKNNHLPRRVISYSSSIAGSSTCQHLNCTMELTNL